MTEPFDEYVAPETWSDPAICGRPKTWLERIAYRFPLNLLVSCALGWGVALFSVWVVSLFVYIPPEVFMG